MGERRGGREEGGRSEDRSRGRERRKGEEGRDRAGRGEAAVLYMTHEV